MRREPRRAQGARDDSCRPCAFYLFIRVMEITDILSQNVPLEDVQYLVLPPLSVGEMTLRLYGALNYSQNSARDLRCAVNGALSASFVKECVHITNSKQRKHQPCGTKYPRFCADSKGV